MSCLSLYHDMTVQCVCNHGIRLPWKIFRLLKLRFRPSFFPGSHHVPWQHNQKKSLWKHSQHQVPCFKQQNSSHVHNNSNMRNIAIKPIISRTTSTFLHDVSLRSASNSKFWMPSRTLLSLSSLRDIWQRNELQTKTKIYRLLCHSVCLAPF